MAADTDHIIRIELRLFIGRNRQFLITGFPWCRLQMRDADMMRHEAFWFNTSVAWSSILDKLLRRFVPCTSLAR